MNHSLLFCVCVWIKWILHGSCLLDYNQALNMYEPSWAETPEEFEGWVSLNGRNCTKKDWTSFFTSMCPLAKFKFDDKSAMTTVVSIWSSIVIVHIFLIMFIRQNRIMGIKHFGLRRVYLEYAKFVFGGRIKKKWVMTIIKKINVNGNVVHIYDTQRNHQITTNCIKL